MVVKQNTDMAPACPDKSLLFGKPAFFLCGYRMVFSAPEETPVLDKSFFPVILTTMKIAVVGCGGNGGVVAGTLARKGLDVACIDINHQNVKAIQSKGIRLIGKEKVYAPPVAAFNEFSQQQEEFDVIIIAVKADALKDVFAHAKNYLTHDGFIVTLQNGLVVLEVAEQFPQVKIVGGAVGYNSVMEDYGTYRLTSKGGITAGNLTTACEEDMNKLKEILAPHIRVDVTTNIQGALWSKLLIVCGATGFGGITGVLVGKLLRSRVARNLFFKLVTEGCEVASELGIHLEKLPGAINPHKFSENSEGYPLGVRHLVLILAGIKYRSLKSNIHHSLEKGQKTEVDYINGTVVKYAQRVGIDTPVNREVVRMVKEIEQGRRAMGMQNLYEIWEKLSRAFT
ncbi:MAG: ketopantoate reductase family protein [Spirochaetota bacterium]